MTEVATPEQMLFASTAQAFLEKEASLSRIRELHAQGASFEPGWWRRAAELGWASLLVPEELGGGSVSGDGVSDLAVVAQQIGRTVAPGPLHPVSVVLAGLSDAENVDQHTGTIEALVAGELIASWAVYEPRRPWSPLTPGVTATATDSGYRLDGVKDRVEAGAESGVLLVVAATEDGVRQFLVPSDATGVTVEAQRSLDLVKRHARVSFNGVDVDASAAVGSAEQTPALIERQTQIARVLQCAEAVGIFDAVFDMTVQWAFDRHTFGRPLVSYQALKHKFADMKLWLEACRATTKAAVAEVATRAPSAGLTVSIAKSYVGERTPVALQQCVQLHGGIGVTWEHDLHLYLRRIALYRAMYGTPEELNVDVYRQLDELESAS
jgi:alkylation response protein AidB-like acyl-CoA dehydrogenase